MASKPLGPNDADTDEENVQDEYIDPEDVLEIDEEDGADYPMDDEDELEDGEGAAGPSGENDILEDTSIRSFTNHASSVFAVAVHPSAQIAASGGEDDLGYIWDYSTGEVLVKLTGHTDSVSNVGFSYDGEMIATGGMDGKVRVWKRVGQQDFKRWTFLTELQGPDEVMWLRWHPKGNVLLAGSNDTTVWLWNLPSGNTMQVFASHASSVACGEFTPDGKRILTADTDGTLILWDPRSPTPLWKLTSDDGRFDLDGITSLAVNPASTVAVVGGASGGIRIVNLAKGDIVGSLAVHDEGESVEAIAFVGFAGTAEVVVTGSTDGKACVWDLNTLKIRNELKHGDSVTCLVPLPAPKSHMVISGSADRVLRTWDTRTGALVKEHQGHRGPVLGAAVGHEGGFVLSAGDDGACLVFAAE
ncbi:ribosome biogenesis protein Sqt1 [Thelephora terrestris]|uniref:Ribosome biogenesis protein Sqt1 n=1 Tax=Thelephora terrestris TaxID=56493 RepID=A0A9P6HMY6_9AGAM|nr:ribosome biogenesis protein Sqt1 [Thelephora terrestris]